MKARAVPEVSTHVVLLTLSLPHFYESDFLFALHGRQRCNKSRNAPVTRRVFLAVLATIFALTALADAAGTPDRYCLQGSQSDYPGNCQFNP
jgi:hypothetical protein